MYLRFPLAHGYFHGKFGAIERLNLLRALTPLLCQSHRDKYFWNFMSSLYVILFCNFYVTIWCKDNKLIIYLSVDSIAVHEIHSWQLSDNFICWASSCSCNISCVLAHIQAEIKTYALIFFFFWFVENHVLVLATCAKTFFFLSSFYLHTRAPFPYA